ncbi:hypothetical protein ACOKM3_14210 [Streptomyces sp. BH106]|uniref:hypothetical protein n=1 Tax=Streptomyces sp. BH106 TaxID=3410409 RepID=UPI003CF4956D
MPESPYAKKPFDPSCTVRTQFDALAIGDRVDYWGEPRPVVDWCALDFDRVRIIVQGEHGRDMALAPGSEAVWRQRRPHEPAATLAPCPSERAWRACADCRTPITCSERRDVDQCP